VQNIPLAAEPNQDLAVRLDDTRYGLLFKEANGVMVVSITIDGVLRLSSSRVLGGKPLIPYDYLERGNFLLLTTNEELPDYREFGVSQSLVYLSPAEIAALRNG